MNIIVQSGAKPVILVNSYDASTLNSYYDWNYHEKMCALSLLRLKKTLYTNCDMVVGRDENYQWFFNTVSELKKKYPSLIIIDMYSVHCPDGICRGDIRQYPVYADTEGHLTDYASYEFGKEYLQKYGNPF